MRIQETDRILKEARYGRQPEASRSEQEESGIVTRAWRALSSFPSRIAGLFRR